MSSYITYTELTDSGPYITKLILKMPQKIIRGTAYPEGFSVFVRRRSRDTGEIIKTERKSASPESVQSTNDGLSQGWRTIKAVYPCDEEGEPTDVSARLALEMSYGPMEPLSHCSAPKTAMLNDFVDMEIRVTQLLPIPGAPAAMGLVFDTCDGDVRPAVSGWKFSEEVSADHPLRYGWFEPCRSEGERRPLLIWLHGAGGGGKDPHYPVQGSRVTAFSSVESQKKMGGPWVYVPQCPTVWMDDGEGTPLMTHNKSKYTHILKNAIDAFVAEHADGIDTERIYIAGASNGGFMTVIQALHYPDFYAAAVPVCEAVMTEQLTQEDIAALAKTPMWFVHAKNDFVVSPEKTVVPLYQRLQAVGADVHFTYWDSIKDTSGRFKNPDGTQYHYPPHFAWVPAFNDACCLDYDASPILVNGRAVSLQEWVGYQKKE